MGTRAQKIGLILVVVAVAVFLVYRGSIPLPDSLEDILPVRRQTSTTPVPTGAVVTSPTPAIIANPSGDVGAVFTEINARRVDAGVSVLTNHAVLQSLAAEHASDMATRNYFDHDTPEGVSFQDRLFASGYGSGAAAENIGIVTDSPADVIDIWMQSAQHQDFMLSPAYRSLGVGVAAGSYQGQLVFYVVAVFGEIQ